jgi:hypothetical protein
LLTSFLFDCTVDIDGLTEDGEREGGEYKEEENCK